METNPIAITKSGISIIGTSAGGTRLVPLNTNQHFFTMNAVVLTVQNCLFELSGPGISTDSCFDLSGTFRFNMRNSSLSYFQAAVHAVGTNLTVSVGIIDNCSFGQNGNPLRFFFVCIFCQ